MDVEDIRVQSAQVENVLSKPGQSQLESDDLKCLMLENCYFIYHSSLTFLKVQ